MTDSKGVRLSDVAAHSTHAAAAGFMSAAGLIPGMASAIRLAAMVEDARVRYGDTIVDLAIAVQQASPYSLRQIFDWLRTLPIEEREPRMRQLHQELTGPNPRRT